MINDRDRFVGSIREQLPRGEPIDVPALVGDPDPADAAALETAFVELLEDPAEFETHPFVVAGLRVLAERGKLGARGGLALLEHTEPLARETGQDEWYKSLDVLALSRVTAELLIPFAQELLETRRLRDWRWLAFVAIEGAERHRLELPTSFRDRLRAQIPAEPDEGRRAEMRAVLDQPGR